MSVNQFISAAILRALGLDAWPTRGVSGESVSGGVTPTTIREEEKDS